MATSPVPVSPALSHGSPGFGPGGLTEGRRARRAQDAGRLILGPGGGVLSLLCRPPLPGCRAHGSWSPKHAPCRGAASPTSGEGTSVGKPRLCASTTIEVCGGGGPTTNYSRIKLPTANKSDVNFCPAKPHGLLEIHPARLTSADGVPVVLRAVLGEQALDAVPRVSGSTCGGPAGPSLSSPRPPPPSAQPWGSEFQEERPRSTGQERWGADVPSKPQGQARGPEAQRPGWPLHPSRWALGWSQEEAEEG